MCVSAENHCLRLPSSIGWEYFQLPLAGAVGRRTPRWGEEYILTSCSQDTGERARFSSLVL